MLASGGDDEYDGESQDDQSYDQNTLPPNTTLIYYDGQYILLYYDTVTELPDGSLVYVDTVGNIAEWGLPNVTVTSTIRTSTSNGSITERINFILDSSDYAFEITAPDSFLSNLLSGISIATLVVNGVQSQIRIGNGAGNTYDAANIALCALVVLGAFSGATEVVLIIGGIPYLLKTAPGNADNP